MTTTMRSKVILPVASVLLALLAGCSSASYEQDEKNISAEPGEEFTLSVPVATYMGEHWYLGIPKPDADVVRLVGDKEKLENSDDDVNGGSSGTHDFTFRAVAPGTAKIRLLQCPTGGCAGGGTQGGPVTPSPVPSGSPGPDEPARYHTYTVTVTK